MGEYRLDYLVRRGHQYYFRRAIPSIAIPYLIKSEIKLSLRTDQPDIARRRCRIISNVFERFFDYCGLMSELPANVIDKIIKEYFAAAMQEVREIVKDGVGGPNPGIDVAQELIGTEKFLKSLKSELASRNFQLGTIGIAEGATENSGNPFPKKGTDSFDDLCEGILRAKIEQSRIYAAMLSGDYDQIEPKDALFKAPAYGTYEQKANFVGSEITVGELADKFIKLKSGSNEWVKKTAADNIRVLNWFKLLVGSDLSISSITKGHVEKFRDLMMRVPSSFEKKKEYAGMNVLQAAEALIDGNQISPKTSDKYFKTLKGFLNWCVEEEYLPSVPGANVKIHYKANPQDDRHPFSAKQLQALFASPVFKGCKSQTRRSQPGNVILKDGMYWIPLIGLFTGMRLGEIVQMHCADVKEEDGVWYFDVTTMSDDNGELKSGQDSKSLKTAQSQRRIPLHGILIKLGFLDYLTVRMKNKQQGLRLFPEIKKGSDGYYSHNFSKKFSRYIQAIKVKTPKTVFHSLRHNFKDALDAGGVQDSHQDALMGHTDFKKAKNAYGSIKNIKVLQGDIEKISYQVDFSKLYSND